MYIYIYMYMYMNIYICMYMYIYVYPSFFLNARRGAKVTWGSIDDRLIMVNWSGLNDLERTNIVPTLMTTNNWILLTHPLGSVKSITPPFSDGARRILHIKGNASREKRWWKKGTDKLASHGLDTEVWISLNYCTSSAHVFDLEELFKSESLTDLPDMRSDGVEHAYWPGDVILI